MVREDLDPERVAAAAEHVMFHHEKFYQKIRLQFFKNNTEIGAGRS